mmetsp:Transcript_58362/g.94417  ORF Transcript_58362/g.94417 Transcript_58362/m.94417 type:complete len:291 (+) Transcript_58362:90-962(+)
MSEDGMCADWLGGFMPMLQPWLEMPAYQAVGISAVVWGCILALIWCMPFLSLNFKQQGADRTLSLMHAPLVTALGIFTEMCAVPACKEGPSWVKGPMLVSLGWLIVDMCSMVVCDMWKGWRGVDMSMLVHHVVGLVIFGLGVTFDFGVYVGVTLLISEASSINLTVMWYLTYSGRKNTKLFLANGVVFLLVFFLCRVAFIPYMFYQLATLDFCNSGASLGEMSMRAQGPHMTLAALVFVFCLNLWWFRKLVAGAAKKLRGVQGDGLNVLEAPPRPAGGRDLQQKLLAAEA